MRSVNNLILPILSAILFLFASCQPSPQEKAILDYEQTTGGTKTDLSMDIISLEKVKDISGLDSSKGFLIRKLGDDIGDTISMSRLIYVRNGFDTLSIKNDSLSKYYEGEYQKENSKEKKNYELIQLYLKAQKDFLLKASEYRHKARLYKESIDTVELLKSFEIVGSLWKCTYSIKNPFLNNVKQEITKQYVFSTDNKIISSSSEIDKNQNEAKK